MYENPKNDEEIINEEKNFLEKPGEVEEKAENNQPQNQGRRKISNQEVNRIQVVNMVFQMDVDIVLVIDLTGSMGLFLSAVKEQALHFHKRVKTFLAARNRTVRKLRVKVIGFRDFYYDGEDPAHPPIQESEFFTLPDDEEEFSAFVNSLEAANDGDEPESALEALHMAFHSEWNRPADNAKTRQIIVLFTDASAHPLDDPKRTDPEFNSHYPDGMPESLEELQNAYSDPEVFPANSKGVVCGHRLILFAPINMYPWTDILSHWYPCLGAPMDVVYKLIAGSMD